MSAVSLSGTTLIVSSHPSPGRARECEPITIGVPFPRGAVKDPGHIALVDDDRAAVAVQALATEVWPDGSVRWALLDFQAGGTFAPERRTLPSSTYRTPRSLATCRTSTTRPL